MPDWKPQPAVCRVPSRRPVRRSRVVSPPRVVRLTPAELVAVGKPPRRRFEALPSRVAFPSRVPRLTPAQLVSFEKQRRRRIQKPSSRLAGPVLHPHEYLDARGLYRIFNTAGYRFYRSPHGPPTEDAVPLATNAALPYTTTATFADGTWYLSVSYFNGTIDSGFLPLGDAGETYRVLTLADGAATGQAPAAPLDWRLVASAAGVIRIVAAYYALGDDRADQWAIAYTIDGNDPPEDDPDLTEDLPTGGLAVLDYALPAASDGVTVKVRLQTRRNDGTAETPVWGYSRDSTILSIAADATGPTTPPAIDRWPGPLIPNP